MEVDNIQVHNMQPAGGDPEWSKKTLERAIATVTRATEHDMEGAYEEAITLYDTALSDFNTVLCSEKSQVVRDCMLPKMDAYADRSLKLKRFLRRSRSPSGASLDAGTDGDPTETSASSDSGVETADDLATGHNVSTDSGNDESDYARIYERQRRQERQQQQQTQEWKHQQQSRKKFLDACAEQVEQLLQIIKDDNESEEIRERARKRCLQILDFAEAYRGEFQPCSAASDVPPVARTVSVASSVAAADPLLSRQLVQAEVLLSAEDETELTDGGCPEPPADGDEEFRPLSFSIDSLRFADADSRRSDSPDYATVRRATPSPRKHLSQASLNKIEPDAEPLLADGGRNVQVLPAAAQRRPKRWWRRHGPHEQPEPMDRSLAEPSLFWIVLGSICG